MYITFLEKATAQLIEKSLFEHVSPMYEPHTLL